MNLVQWIYPACSKVVTEIPNGGHSINKPLNSIEKKKKSRDMRNTSKLRKKGAEKLEKKLWRNISDTEASYVTTPNTIVCQLTRLISMHCHAQRMQIQI
jgi:hypothetical protein